MIYELTIEDKKEKQVIAFLKELDFVKIKKIGKKITTVKDRVNAKQRGISYFGACLDWDIDASELRAKSSRKHNQKW